jgi:hypothetical protein
MSITRSERSDAGETIVTEVIDLRQVESVFTLLPPQECLLVSWGGIVVVRWKCGKRASVFQGPGKTCFRFSTVRHFHRFGSEGVSVARSLSAG